MAIHKKLGVASPAEAIIDGVTPKPAKRVDLELEAINARNKQALSEALSKAQAVKITPPPAFSAPISAKRESKKEAKPKKIKLVRDGFAMPESEYMAISVLKQRLAAMGHPVKKSELIRAGIVQLLALGEAELQAVMSRVERIKTGRPRK